MAEVIREGQRVRVVLVDGDTQGSASVVEKVKQALLDGQVVEVVVEIPSAEESPDQPIASEVIQLLEAETRGKGVPLRFRL